MPMAQLGELEQETGCQMDHRVLEQRLVPEPTLLTLLTRRRTEDKGLGPAIANAVALEWLRERLSDPDVYTAVLESLGRLHVDETSRADAVLDAIARQLVGHRF